MMRNKSVFHILLGVYIIGSALSMIFAGMFGANPTLFEAIGSLCVILGVGIIIALSGESYFKQEVEA